MGEQEKLLAGSVVNRTSGLESHATVGIVSVIAASVFEGGDASGVLELEAEGMSLVIVTCASVRFFPHPVVDATTTKARRREARCMPTRKLTRLAGTGRARRGSFILVGETQRRDYFRPARRQMGENASRFRVMRRTRTISSWLLSAVALGCGRTEPRPSSIEAEPADADVTDAASDTPIPADAGLPACKPDDPVMTLSPLPSHAIATDASFVYFATKAPSGGIHRVGKIGGAPEKVGGLPTTLAFALTPTHVVYTDPARKAEAGRGVVARVPKEGGPEELLHDYEIHPGAIAWANDFVYYVSDRSVTPPGLSSIMRIDSTKALKLLGTTNGDVQSIAVSGTDVYFTTGRQGRIDAISTVTPTLRPIVYGERETIALSVDGSDVFALTVGTDGAARLIRSNPASMLTVFARPLSAPNALVLDSTHIYWTDLADRTVSRIRRDGSEWQVVLRVASPPRALAIDPFCVYVATDDGIVRAPR